MSLLMLPEPTAVGGQSCLFFMNGNDLKMLKENIVVFLKYILLLTHALVQVRHPQLPLLLKKSFSYVILKQLLKDLPTFYYVNFCMSY